MQSNCRIPKILKMTAKLKQCPCCDYFTLTNRGYYEICKICFWEDDGLDLTELKTHSGPNHMTLEEGRMNFLKFGACDEKSLKHVINESERSNFKYNKRTTDNFS